MGDIGVCMGVLGSSLGDIRGPQVSCGPPILPQERFWGFLRNSGAVMEGIPSPQIFTTPPTPLLEMEFGPILKDLGPLVGAVLGSLRKICGYFGEIWGSF